MKKKKKRGPLDYVALFGKGFCIGAADIVPGVSGGTMAFILGIYQELIDAIHAFNLTFIGLCLRLRIRAALNHFPWKFMSSLLAGVLCAIFLMTHFLKEQLHENPDYVLSVFFGLVLASVVTVGRRGKPWTVSRLMCGFASAASAFVLVGLVPTQTPETKAFLFLSGIIAFCALILPGISGSFMLLLLGKYYFALDRVHGLKQSIKNMDIHQAFQEGLPLAIIVLGGIVGLIAFSRVVHWLMNSYYLSTVACLTGLMIGSLRKVWPWKVDYFQATEANQWPSFGQNRFWSDVGFMAAGLAVVLIVEWAASGKVTSKSSAEPSSNAP